MKVLFLGNHTVGVRALRVIARSASLVGVVAHPDDPEDGVRYESVFAAATKLGVKAIRAGGKSLELAEFVRETAPDFIWITDYRYLLPASVLTLAPRGAVNLHPSLLPKYRGRAPLNWAILQGETRLGLTAHFVDAGMDSGDVIAQRSFVLSRQQDVGDALNLLYPLYEDLTAEVISHFCASDVPRQMQDATQATAFPRRTPADGIIDWNAPAESVWNLIRAVAAPYPGAFTPWCDGRVRVWRGAVVERLPVVAGATPGEVLEVFRGGKAMTVACADRALVISEFSLEDATVAPQPGDRLGLIGAGAAEVLAR